MKDDNNSNSSNTSDDDSNETNKASGSDEDSDNENDNDDIVDNVESSDTDSLSDSKKKKKRKVTSITKSVFTPFLKNQLQFYIRNALFQKVKIVDESHLETGGTIIKEVFERLKLDKSSSNINAYVNETRQIIKRVISSRRGYIKKKIGAKFEGKLSIFDCGCIMVIYTHCLIFRCKLYLKVMKLHLTCLSH